MSEEKILDRVRKLLATANDERGNEHERDNALRMAHNLLTKHGLSLMQVEAHEKDKADPRGKFDDIGLSTPWARRVRHAIADLFMCKYFFGSQLSSTRCTHYFVGRESNAVTAMYMSAYVVRSIVKEATKLYGHPLNADARSFSTGCASRLRQRIDQMIADKAKEVGPQTGGTALALLDLARAEKDANDAWLEASGVQLTTSKGRSAGVNAAAYSAGHAHGGSISLNVQIAKPDNARLGHDK